jgi:hypothetical protein
LQGTQGIQGPANQGAQSSQGTQGLQGSQGAQGTQGTGNQGAQGVQGFTGGTGGTGLQGSQGTQGTQGLQGSQGTQGLQGSQGTQGLQGLQGVQGVQGTGSQGSQGTQGTGSQGIQGAGSGGGISTFYNINSSIPNYYIGLSTVNSGITTALFASPTLTVSGLGSVGIGTTNPTQKLDIDGNIRLRSSLYDSNNNPGIGNSILISTGAGVSWGNIVVTQDQYGCLNPINVVGNTIGIGSTSNAYGSRYFQPTEPINSCDGDIWFDTSGTGGVGSQGAQGVQGLQGIQGLAGNVQGPQGTQGLQGRQGTQGSQGVQNAQGTQGLQGSQGTQGLQGSQGTQGLQGSQGTQGLQGSGTQGSQGSQGSQGLQGSGTQGSQGLQGTQGIQGVQGLQGTQGTANQGPQGPQGTQGIQSAQGSQGIQSAQGVQGTANQGTQGAQGVQGTANQGSQGAQGLQGNQGTQGLQGLSNQGVQGSQGLQGTQGVQGVQGTANQGPQGPQGSQGIQSAQGVQGTSNQGPQGVQGVSNQGSQGVQGISNQGAQGVQGRQSAQGVQGTSNQGVQGPTGPIGSFSGVFDNDVWYITANDAKNRFYFAESGRTSFGSQNGYEWQNATNTNIMDISNTGDLTVTGLINARKGINDTTGTGGALRIELPGGAAYATSTNLVTGAIKIRLPVLKSSTNTMLMMRVKVYEYDGVNGSHDVGTSRIFEIGGYPYAAGGWYNVFACQTSMNGVTAVNVRYGYDTAGYACVWIGETDKVWDYPQVFVTEFEAGYSGYAASTWASNWAVTFETSFNTVERGPITASIPANITSLNILNIIGISTFESTVRFKDNIELDATKTMYFGREESFGGGDTGGADYGYITWENDYDTYAILSSSGENGCLRIGTQNDYETANSDNMALEPAASLYLNPGGDLYKGNASTRQSIWYGSGTGGNISNNSLTLTESLRSNVKITGGGNIAVNASGYVKWDTRFIVISNGRGSNFSTNGYFDISCPLSGTITGVGGAGNVTATSNGIPLGGWEALYYILPLGSSNGSLADNFRIASYTSDLDIPYNWVLICSRNGDDNKYYFPNRGTLTQGGSQGIASPINFSDRTNWASNGAITAVVGQLAWKNYGNNHTIFDASASTSPDGTSVNNTNSEVAWTGTYPTLMGWNGANTYGVRVDSARLADSSTSTNLLNALGNYVWSGSSLPQSFNQGIQCSFVQESDGFPNYGSLLNMRTYSAGGGSLQLYVPYSPTYGGNALKVRFGNYDVSSGNSWTDWKDIVTSDAGVISSNITLTVGQTGYNCTNPITVSTPSTGAKQIDIASASNAYGTRYIQATAPASPCEGDIWYDTSTTVTSTLQRTSTTNIAGQSVIVLTNTIPSWANEITIMYSTVQLQPPNAGHILFGVDSAANPSSTYFSNTSYLNGGIDSGKVTSTSALVAWGGQSTMTGEITLKKHIRPSGNHRWIASGAYSFENNISYIGWNHGYVETPASAPVNRIYIFTSTSVNFSSGDVSVLYQ